MPCRFIWKRTKDDDVPGGRLEESGGAPSKTTEPSQGTMATVNLTPWTAQKIGDYEFKRNTEP